MLLQSEQYGLSLLAASSLVTWHEVGGFVGGFGSSWLSDALGGKRAAAAAVFGVLSCGSFVVLAALGRAGPAALFVLLPLAGVGVHVGLYPIVTLQYRSTTLYQVSYQIQ